MNNGETRQVTVIAKEKWNATTVRVLPGQKFRLVATGQWNDGGIDTTADGFSPGEAPLISRPLLALFASALRLRNNHYFSLVGAVDRRDESLFTIGSVLDAWTAKADGHLECFANDVPFAYFNNNGSLHLTITRLA